MFRKIQRLEQEGKEVRFLIVGENTMKVYVVRNPNNPVNIDGMYTSKARAETHAKNENKIFWNGNEVLTVEEINVATNKKVFYLR